MPRQMSDEERELRAYKCEACGALPGKPCKVVGTGGRSWRNRGKPTNAHQYRRDQRRRDKLGGTFREVFVPDTPDGLGNSAGVGGTMVRKQVTVSRKRRSRRELDEPDDLPAVPRPRCAEDAEAWISQADADLAKVASAS